MLCIILICDIFCCDKAIHIVVWRCVTAFTVSMVKSCIYCFLGLSIIKSQFKYLSLYFFPTFFMHVYNLFVYISVFFFLFLVFRLCRLSDFLFHFSYRRSFMLQNFILMDVSTYCHVPCHWETHSMWVLNNRSLGICFFL